MDAHRGQIQAMERAAAAVSFGAGERPADCTTLSRDTSAVANALPTPDDLLTKYLDGAVSWYGAAAAYCGAGGYKAQADLGLASGFERNAELRAVTLGTPVWR